MSDEPDKPLPEPEPTAAPEDTPPESAPPESAQPGSAPMDATPEPATTAGGSPDAAPAAGTDEDFDGAEDEDEESESPLPIGGLYLALSFLTRLPFRLRETPAPGALARAMGAFPLAGVVVGGIGAAVYALLHQLLPASASAILALAATMLVTGGLHEDGLADTADGFGGGADRDQKLAIMRDSRIGTYGVLALIVTFTLRAVALAEIGDSLIVAGALIASHALARGAIPVAMQALAPARSDGLGAAAGQPSATQIGVAVTLAVVIAALALPASTALAALAGATLGMMLVVGVAQMQIGGHTGDVLGAIEQCAETLALLGVLAAL
jgi:adenosylcobinamide-GDP ribazoletransferase